MTQSKTMTFNKKGTVISGVVRRIMEYHGNDYRLIETKDGKLLYMNMKYVVKAPKKSKVKG